MWTFCRFNCRFHIPVMRRSERQITGGTPNRLPVCTEYLSRYASPKNFPLKSDRMYRGMANLERFRGCSHSAGHGRQTIRHTGRMSSVTRFHLLGTFRLTLSKPRTYKEVLSLKERFSPMPETWKCTFREEIRPFFAAW